MSRYFFQVVALFALTSTGFAVMVPKAGSQAMQPLQCEQYDYQKCTDTDTSWCNRTMTCQPEDGKQMFCFASWRNNSKDGFEVLHKGCWTEYHKCFNQSECVGKVKATKGIVHCCCETSFCNRHFRYNPVEMTTSSFMNDEPIIVKEDTWVTNTFLFTLVPLTGFAVIVAVSFWMWRKHKLTYADAVLSSNPCEIAQESPPMGFRPIQLLEVKAHGRFGAVWKALMAKETVAVKIFPIQDKLSWLQENEIYELPQMSHPNVLRFIGSEKRGDNLNLELWLITEYHEKGSLYDYLKGSTLTWSEICRLGETMVAGLAFVHDDCQATITELHKPAIAHRDFKSRNVLLKHDLTACLADFGLATKFEAGKGAGDTHGQVGTRRYMAPEVLEGAINFNRDAFMRIDMYACGLVLWEIISRCTVVDGPVEAYQLPFEDEVGAHPTLEDMQEVVVHKRMRPSMKEHWLKHPGIAALCETTEECWDHDAEARLSAGCVKERIAMLAKTVNTATSQNNLNNTADVPDEIGETACLLPSSENVPSAVDLHLNAIIMDAQMP